VRRGGADGREGTVEEGRSRGKIVNRCGGERGRTEGRERIGKGQWERQVWRDGPEGR
jgi:hypothetical protein